MADTTLRPKSRGHVAFFGDHDQFELFEDGAGTLFRAPSNAPLDTSGYRMGARFESTPAGKPLMLKVLLGQ